MRLIALQTNRRNPSIGGDTRKQLGLHAGSQVFLSDCTGAHYASANVKKVPLSTARATELAVKCAKTFDGVVFLPAGFFSTLGIKPQDPVMVHQSVESVMALRDEQVSPAARKAVRSVAATFDEAVAEILNGETKPVKVSQAVRAIIAAIPAGVKVSLDGLTQALYSAQYEFRGSAAVAETIRTSGLTELKLAKSGKGEFTKL